MNVQKIVAKASGILSLVGVWGVWYYSDYFNFGEEAMMYLVFVSTTIASCLIHQEVAAQSLSAGDW